MGKRLIISESEKKKILSLYETSKKVLSISPPPSESELVIRKNPWRDSEYENARRFYSPSLKDGELFSVIIGDDRLLSEILLKNIQKLLNGKKIKEGDVFYTFGNNINVESIGFRDISKLGGDDSLIKEIKIKVPNDFRGVTFWETSSLTLNLIDNTYRYWSKEKYGDEYDYTEYTAYEWIKNIIDFIKGQTNSTTLKSLPDDFFEIRKIQREKTDF